MFNDSGIASIHQTDKKTYTVVKTVAGYTETLMKIVGTVSLQDITEEDLAKIHTCSEALMGYLNDEHSTLFASNQCDQDTAKIFRSLKKNTSVFTEEDITKVIAASTIAGLKNTNQGGIKKYPRGGGGGQRTFRNYGNNYGNTSYGNSGYNQYQPRFNNQQQYRAPGNRQEGNWRDTAWRGPAYGQGIPQHRPQQNQQQGQNNQPSL